jgi:hypothetical protein
VSGCVDIPAHRPLPQRAIRCWAEQVTRITLNLAQPCRSVPWPQAHGHPVMQPGKVGADSRGDDGKRPSDRVARPAEALPQSNDCHRLPIMAGDGGRLLFGLGRPPLIEGVHRHDAAVSLECATERAGRGDGLCPGVDRAVVPWPGPWSTTTAVPISACRRDVPQSRNGGAPPCGVLERRDIRGWHDVRQRVDRANIRATASAGTKAAQRPHVGALSTTRQGLFAYGTMMASNLRQSRRD